METVNDQYRKQMECMKQIQTDIQEVKNSIESWQNHLNKTEDRLSDWIATRDYVRKIS